LVVQALQTGSAVRREPFRLFFPLGLALGMAGMLPWLLFAQGVTHAWPGLGHALTMTQSSLAALAVGFLGTMLPRRTGCRPLSFVELGLLAAGLLAVPVSLELGSLVGAEAGFLVVLGTLVRFASRKQGPLPGLALVPAGVLLGALGAALLLAVGLGAGGWAGTLGRNLATQGMLLGMALGLAPMLSSIVVRDVPLAGPPRRELLTTLLFVASFAVEEWLSIPGGLALRAAVAAYVVGRAGIPRRPARRGLHRLLFQAAMMMIPLGLAAAALAPDRRISFLHITFVGGLSLLSLAVSVHVTALHTGRAAMADRNPWTIPAAAALVLVAGTIRLVAERVPSLYFVALTAASGLWLAGAILWASFVLRRKAT
jgi:uncharacterized protein involved in response to NO